MKLVTWIVVIAGMQGTALLSAALMRPASWLTYMGWVGLFFMLQLPLPVYLGVQMMREEVG
jgi:hypothetical protein